jgi:uncharacterized protein
MRWNRVLISNVAVQPWRNGGGVTREFLAWPDRDNWTVRISVADIMHDGPFSSYPGVERWFAVLAGNGVRLTLPEGPRELTESSAPLRFDGGDAPACHLLNGPTRDFNLMIGKGRASVERLTRAGSKHCLAGHMIAVYANGRGTTVDGELLAPEMLAWRMVKANERVKIDGKDALWMEITP